MSVEPLSRRSMLRSVGVTAAAGVVGYVVARASGTASAKGATTAANGHGRAPGTSGRLLAPESQVPVGSGLILADAGIVLTRDSAGVVRGWSATCTHQGCTVNAVKGGTINCPCHGSRFDPTTGAPVAGPARQSLPAIPVVVRDNNVYTG